MTSVKNIVNEKLIALRENQIGQDDFQSWISSNLQVIQNEFTRGDFLKLKRGDLLAIQKLLIERVPACSICEALFKEGLFSGVDDFKIVIKRTDDSVANGFLVKIDKPSWVSSDASPLALSIYYRCQKCSAIWELSGSEREFPGSWIRVA